MEKIHYTHDRGGHQECHYHPKGEAVCFWGSVDWRLYDSQGCARRADGGIDAALGLEQTFKELADKWKNETGHLSAIDDIVLHPAYQSIIGMGPSVIPFLLRELQQAPNHWFWALEHIARQNPVPPEDVGRMRRMTEAWLDWGRLQGYL
jgi:hypothetical protein